MFDVLFGVDGVLQLVWYVVGVVLVLVVGVYVDGIDGSGWCGWWWWCVKVVMCLQIVDRQVVCLYLFQDLGDCGFVIWFWQVIFFYFVCMFGVFVCWLLRGREVGVGCVRCQWKMYKNNSSWVVYLCCECGGLLCVLCYLEIGDLVCVCNQ